jgi:hypothetical protein
MHSTKLLVDMDRFLCFQSLNVRSEPFHMIFICKFFYKINLYCLEFFHYYFYIVSKSLD